MANFLPGLKKAGARIIIGCSWLVLVWLVVRPYLPAPSEAKGDIGNIYELAGILGKLILLPIALVGAWAIGSLTVPVLMFLLSILPVPRDIRTVYLMRPELAGRPATHDIYRSEPTVPYVVQGWLPPELYSLARFNNAFNNVCAEAEFLWSAPFPVVIMGSYLALTQSAWWAVPAGAAPLLMVIGYRRFVLACRMLKRAAVAQVTEIHKAALQAWDLKNGRIKEA